MNKTCLSSNLRLWLKIYKFFFSFILKKNFVQMVTFAVKLIIQDFCCFNGLEWASTLLVQMKWLFIISNNKELCRTTIQDYYSTDFISIDRTTMMTRNNGTKCRLMEGLTWAFRYTSQQKQCYASYSHTHTFLIIQ